MFILAIITIRGLDTFALYGIKTLTLQTINMEQKQITGTVGTGLYLAQQGGKIKN